MKTALIAAVLTTTFATASFAEPVAYNLDASHSQVVFSYDHLGFSTSWGMFSGFEGNIMFDADDPSASTVSVSMPVMSMLTGWEARFNHFMGEDFFFADDDSMITFTSTGIEVTGDNTALITGDLTMNNVTKSVVLDTILNKAGDHPMAGKPWLGFSATTSVIRTDFGLGNFAPFVGDVVNIQISIEAAQAE